MSILNQYANSVINFSSQYNSDWASAQQALGAPNANYGNVFAWLPANRDNTIETLTVGFATAVYATGVTIRETNGNGFVTKIEGLFRILWDRVYNKNKVLKNIYLKTYI